MTAREVLAGVALLGGGVFCLLAGIGVLRMPDVYTRMQASTKAGTLGVGFIILAVMFYFDSSLVAAEAFLVIGFLFATAPIASHLIARASYYVRVKAWDRTSPDELRESGDARRAEPPPPDPATPPEQER